MFVKAQLFIMSDGQIFEKSLKLFSLLAAWLLQGCMTSYESVEMRLLSKTGTA